jgi:hypothetical protein
MSASEGDETVLRRIRDMPPGTLGFEAVGEVGTRLREFEGDAISESARAFRVPELPAAERRLAAGLDADGAPVST